jgi:methyltransferase family protein
MSDAALNEIEAASGAFDALLRLCDPALDPLFWPNARPTVLSAWHGHVPFAHWLVTAARPATIVELGTHGGGSYAAFCEGVLQNRLNARCFAIDTWRGDDHSGHYGDAVFEDFKQFHDERYGRFSRLLRAEFDDAARNFPASSIDLLHIDGLHTYEAVRNDFATWLPKMSGRGIVLLHDTAVQQDGFGVGRLWSELQARYPHFGFPHCYGLGVLAVGADPPAAVAALCGLGEAGAARVRSRFARLGETHELRAALLIARLRAQQNARLDAASPGRSPASA